MSWEEYLDNCLKSYPEDISLFPLIDEEEDTSSFREKLRKARFRWLKECFESDELDEIYRSWQAAIDALVSERELVGGELWEFYRSSDWLFLYMLRAEASNLTYYKTLRSELRLRVSLREPVLFFGPTAGAELEAIADAGGLPKVVHTSNDSKWEVLLEERLIHDSIPFQTYTYNEFAKTLPRVKFVVLSNFIPSAAVAVRVAFNCLENYGFVLFHSANKAMTREAEKLGMLRRTDNSDPLALYFRHNGISSVGAVDVCNPE